MDIPQVVQTSILSRIGMQAAWAEMQNTYPHQGSKRKTFSVPDIIPVS